MNKTAEYVLNIPQLQLMMFTAHNNSVKFCVAQKR